jgi:hypothetical protein
LGGAQGRIFSILELRNFSLSVNSKNLLKFGNKNPNLQNHKTENNFDKKNPG